MPCVQNSAGRVNQYGIEVANGVMWQGWEPGREYTKNIVLKNVRVKTQKLKYKVPTSRFFTTLYPKQIVLSAGTSFTLPVTFRPLEKGVYEDNIEFLTNEGQFTVPMRAVLPEVEVAAPEHINFNMCAAQDSIQLTFEIRNVSELVTPFQVQCGHPFIVSPTEGVLKPYSTFQLHTIFKPTAAHVYEAQAVIKYGPKYDHVKITRLEGIGKYPHLLVGNSSRALQSPKSGLCAVVDFGQVVVGNVVEKWIELQNLSPVNAPYRVEHPTAPSSIDTVFQCLQKDGVVPANSTAKIPVVFSPNTVGCKSIDYLHVVAIGNISKTVIQCVGQSAGPAVHLSQTTINFLQVDAGHSVTRTFDMVNDSDAEAPFQFMLDCDESVFKFEATSGTLSPHSKRTMILKFQPIQPINYYRRVSVVVHNQMPLFLDLLGTCHTETCKPAVLQGKHIEQYRMHVERKLSILPPEQLNEMLREGKLCLEKETGTLMHKDDDSSCMQHPPVHAMDEYFNDGYHTDLVSTQPHVSMDNHQAHFARTTDMNIVQKMNFNVTNHTHGKISVVWMGGPEHIFSVAPASVDIAPLSAAPFTVTFKPTKPNKFYGCELEGYAYYKSMRDYRLVEDTTHCPPWCLSLVATGHTFSPHCETFLPRFMMDSHKLVFPAVNAGEATYRTVLLTNTGDTPILFDFEPDESSIFHMKPTMGLLRGGQQLFVIKISPRAVKTYKKTLRLKMNAADKNTQEITAWGSAEAAEVLLDNHGEMYFQPTCIGTASTRQYAVKNVSRIPLNFEWRMKHAEAQMLTVQPSAGLINPNESQVHTWSFKPGSEAKFVMKPALIVWGQGQGSNTSGGKKRQFQLRCIGEGTIGAIKATIDYMDYGTIVVGSCGSKNITLQNPSNCSLYYRLQIDQTTSVDASLQPSQTTEMVPLALELEQMTGVLPAHSRHVIKATIRPSRRLNYQFNISYSLITPDDGRELQEGGGYQHLAHLLATGVFPTMAVTDARCYGSAINISKKQLWTLFHLDTLNSSLDADPAQLELLYTAETRHSHSRRPPVLTRASVDFNFGAAPVGSEPCTVELMLENTGAVATQWAFLFPNELYLELNYWSETGEYSEEELHEMKVMDNHLFSVQPGNGTLQPGEHRHVTLKYRHVMPGTDRLPVLLKLAQGREILLNFVGVSVEPERRYIHFPSSQFMFSPVAIADQNSPKQIYEMYNGGALPVKYEFDVSKLEIIKQENFDHAVFQLLNPVGEILPGHTANVQWTFSPLEAKTYLVEVPISIHNGDSAVVTFKGIGYDARVMGSTMPLTDQPSTAPGVPAIQSVPVPGQLVYLSEERLSFGNMPLFSRSRRIVTMTNTSTQTAVAYQWHVTLQSDTQFVCISPSKGYLQPGDSCLAKVSFTARGNPSFYDLDLVCEVLNLNEQYEYEQSLLSWEAERHRQRVEFTVTEEDPDADMRSEGDASRPTSGTRLNPIRASCNSPITDLANYKTLPPIKQRSIDRDRLLEKQQQKLEEMHWERPVPPKPFLLHLGITARTHNIADFQTNFPDQYKNFYIDRSLSSSGAAARPVSGTDSIVVRSCVEAEAEIVASALQTVLRGLLDDAGFHESVSQQGNQPTPYFRQFTEHRTATPATPAPSVLIAVDGVVQDGGCDRVSCQPAQATSPAPTSAVFADAPSPSKSHAAHATPAPHETPIAFSIGHQSKRSSSAGSKRSKSSKKSEGSAVGRASAHSRGAAAGKSLLPTTPDVASIHAPSTPPESVREAELERLMEDTSRDLLPEMSLQEELEQGVMDKFDPDVSTGWAEKQRLKKSPEFGSIMESVLENTLLNIMQEAFHKEFNISARPRLIALLPKPSTPEKPHK